MTRFYCSICGTLFTPLTVYARTCSIPCRTRLKVAARASAQGNRGNRALAVLAMLREHRRCVVSSGELTTALYTVDDDASRRALHNVIHRLRRDYTDDGLTIETRDGGYCLAHDIDE